jgi:hypothetical protein
MDKNRKTAIAILGVFSVLIIVAWFLNFKQNLKNPLLYQGDVIVDSRVTPNLSGCSGPNCSVANLNPDNLDLKLLDTDGDKLSDWDELFVYGTSPYLEDTDGDGLTDYEEISVYKTDPLCPEGQNCSGSLNNATAQNSFDSGTEELAVMLEGWDKYYDTSLSADQLPNELQPDQASPEYIRNLLLKEGISQEELDKISDADLMAIYQEVLDDF